MYVGSCTHLQRKLHREGREYSQNFTVYGCMPCKFALQHAASSGVSSGAFVL